MRFIPPQLDIWGVPVSKIRKATGKLVHHGSLHCVACNHEVAESIEGLIQVFDLDEEPFQDNVYTSQATSAETNSKYRHLLEANTQPPARTERRPPSQA